MKLQWLDLRPTKLEGVTFGYPWVKGMYKTISELPINQQAVQSWPLAYWPDGSIKWSGHAFVTDASKQDANTLNDMAVFSHNKLVVEENSSSVKIDTGNLVISIAKQGEDIIQWIKDYNGRILLSQGRLVSSLESTEETSKGVLTKRKPLISKIKNTIIEKSGPIQATIKIDGALDEDDRFLFTLRLIFYKDSKQVKMVHTFLYNDESLEEQIKGLGFQFHRQLSGSSFNRHVRITTTEGVYNEPAQLLASRRFRQSELYNKQLRGEALDVDNQEIYQEAFGNAIWQDFMVTQQAIDRSFVQKRTDKTCSWKQIPTLKNADGVIYAGDDHGGIALGIKDFKEKYPTGFQVEQINESNTTYSLWFYSPEAKAMDLRHYSKETHVESAYEGFPEMRATPVGVANTSEAYLELFDEPPSDQALTEFSNYVERPTLVVTNPEYYYKTKATGTWPLVDTSSHAKEFIEKALDDLVRFYQAEIKQREWYGYWHYGDVMHSYDHARKQWFYDLGGYAWQNTELVPNLWLWYSFFRTGDASIFRMVEAMTRHNSEVDRYHLGEFEGLGSRHNVSHWGCGCKELRISMACLYKYYYYLTADERMLELLDEVKDADQALDRLDPMREFYQREDKLTHARVGPDWASLTSNWMSYYERTRNQVYLDKIKQSLNDIKKTPHRLLSGPTYQYDPKRSKMIYMDTGNEGGYHMIIAFGAPQVWLELVDLLDDQTFKNMVAEFGRVYAMTNEEKQKFSGGKLTNNHFHWPMFASGLMAYSAKYDHDLTLAKTAWKHLLDQKVSGVPLPISPVEGTSYRTLLEIPWITTNVVAQWSLNIFLALSYASEVLDEVFTN
ncbi:hypothetical protein J2T56_002688 [Natronobacillus azotifigens]|uniref:Tat pathway signal sequence domain protein n=1 Tax=Natronobacillus azotifigens TaxID=472978 RepID=A0A9J6RG79_9BACI|nr:hypothetical protein [Natronobacillus azotifigens]MCZ0704339.1 hypothetical protein [Natronobacillus azotifigens]